MGIVRLAEPEWSIHILPNSMAETGIRDVLTCVISFTILWRMVNV